MSKSPPTQKLAHSQSLPVHPHNHQSILQLLSQRIKLVTQSYTELTDQYTKMKSQLDFAMPLDILITREYQNVDMLDGSVQEVMKKTVQAAIGGQFGDNKQLDRFQKRNQQAEEQLHQQMKIIQSLNQQISETAATEQHQIQQLQHTESQLKHALKQKGNISEAQQYQRQKKQKLTEIRNIRQNLSVLKQKKIQKIKHVIELLTSIHDLRTERIHRIQRIYGAAGGIDRQVGLLGGFVRGLDFLRAARHKEKNSGRDQIKEERDVGGERVLAGFESFANIHEFGPGELTSRDPYSDSRQKRASQSFSYSSTPRNTLPPNIHPFLLTQKRESNKKNTNQLPTKKVGTLIPTLQPIRKTYQFTCIEDIVTSYEQVVKMLNWIREGQLMYFKNLGDRLEEEYKVRAIEKSYLLGILGFDPQTQPSPDKYDSIIKFAIIKCNQFSTSLTQKSKQQQKLSSSLTHVQQSLPIFKSQLSLLQSQPSRKQSTLTQLQPLITHHPLRSQIKQLNSQIQQNHIRCCRLRNQQQQYAGLGDLENYKKVQREIGDIGVRLRDLEERVRGCENGGDGFGWRNGEFWGKVVEVFQGNGVDMGVMAKMEAKSDLDLLAKFTKRLMPI